MFACVGELVPRTVFSLAIAAASRTALLTLKVALVRKKAASMNVNMALVVIWRHL